MQNNIGPARFGIRHKLVLAYTVVTTAAVLIAEGVALSILALLNGQIVWGLHILLVILIAATVGLVLGIWASRRIARRIQRSLKVSQAWLRGNLSLRIADPTTDDLGLLATQLDSLAGRLEDDEQDLDELRERNMRLSDQVRALAVVEERNRLARELHDSVKQHLFSLAMTASAIRTRFDAMPDVPGDLLEMAHEIETAAQTAQRETTRLIEDLRPGSLQERGLAAAINDFTLLFGAQEHILVYLEVEGNDGLLPPSVAEALYRVAQEALHNTARHARATRVDVHLRCIPERVTLAIHDNGVGFDTEHVHRGLGLANMQERVMAVGGRLTFQSQTGIGTTVLTEVELPHPLSKLETGRSDQNRPNLSIENWAWLGAKLVIPVGQTWPWLPADLVYLREPLVEAHQGPVVINKVTGFLGLNRGYLLQLEHQNRPPVRLHQSNSGYEWEAEDASWALRTLRSLGGRMVLTRNGQALAAIQYQGRQMNTWSEINYGGVGYRLSYVKDQTGAFILADEAGEELSCATGDPLPRVTLRRTLPLPLIVMATARLLDEIGAVTSESQS